MQCTGTQSCQGATIHCPDLYQCTVDCGSNVGIQACGNAKVVCSGSGVCYLGCAGVQSCQGATMTCGKNACTAGCTSGSATPTVDCGNACGCNHC